MAKPKATTLQQKFGFADGELSTPLHDEIMLWLDTYILEAVSIAADIPTSPHQWDGEKIAEYQKESSDSAEKSAKHWKKQIDWDGTGINLSYNRKYLEMFEGWAGLVVPTPPLQSFEITEKVWEYAVLTRTGFTAGFVDMLARYSTPHLRYYPRGTKNYYNHEHEFLPELEINYESHTMAFEVKPKIPSLGELIRQIRMYQSYIECPFCVVSPDDRFKDALASQGIKFLKYTG